MARRCPLRKQALVDGNVNRGLAAALQHSVPRAHGRDRRPNECVERDRDPAYSVSLNGRRACARRPSVAHLMVVHHRIVDRHLEPQHLRRQPPAAASNV